MQGGLGTRALYERARASQAKAAAEAVAGSRQEQHDMPVMEAGKGRIFNPQTGEWKDLTGPKRGPV